LWEISNMKKGSSNMIKVDTRVKYTTYEQLRKIADDEHEGNFSLALRKIIERGLEFHEMLTPKTFFTRESIEKIIQDVCEHDWGIANLLYEPEVKRICSKCFMKEIVDEQAKT